MPLWLEKLNNVWKQAQATRLFVSRAMQPIPHVPNKRTAKNIRLPILNPIEICQKNHMSPMMSTRQIVFNSFSSPCR